ncbi:MAG: hypothetical protein Dasosvirus8_1, partial [Dasosvirus sp.]
MDIKSDLSHNNFFLHSFMDEYIGDGKGNNPFLTLNEFLKYSPEPYKTNLQLSKDIVQDLDNFLLKIRTLTPNVETKSTDRNDPEYREWEIGEGQREYGDKRAYRYKYKYIDSKQLKPRIEVEDQHLKVINCEKFLAQLHQSRKSLFPKTIATEYFEKYLFIDAEMENKLNGILNEIVAKVISLSLNYPIFLPIGYANPNGGHLIGLVISDKYIAICNSGQGLGYHLLRSEYSEILEGGTQYNDYPQRTGIVNLTTVPKKQLFQERTGAVQPTSTTQPSITQPATVPKKQLFQERTGAVQPTSTAQPNTTQPNTTQPTIEPAKPKKKQKKQMFEERTGVVQPSTEPIEKQIDISIPEDKENYPQCIFHMNRPKDDFVLHEFLKNILSYTKQYENTTIDDVYGSVFKMYIYNKIIEGGYKDNIVKLTRQIINEMASETYMKLKLSGTSETSKILKHVWKHTDYYQESVYYTTSISMSQYLDVYKNLLSERQFKEITEKATRTNQFENLQYFVVSLMHSLNIYEENTYITDPQIFFKKIGGYNFFPIILKEIKTLRKTRRLEYKPAYKDYLARYSPLLFSYDLQSEAIEIVKNNGLKPEIGETETQFAERIKDNPIYIKTLESQYQQRIKYIFPIVLFDEEIKGIIEYIQSILSKKNAKIFTESLDNDRNFDVIELLDKPLRDIRESIQKNIADIKNIDGYNTEKTWINLFFDMLMNSEISNKYEEPEDYLLKFKSDQKYFKIKFIGVMEDLLDGIDISEDTLAKKVLKKLKQTIPNLYNDIMHVKLVSVFKQTFFVREQYAGSCTFNGIFLATSLINIASNPEVTNKQYLVQYYSLLKSIREKQIFELASNDVKLVETDREVIDVLQHVCARSGININNVNGLDVAKKLKQMLPSKTISSLDVKYKEIVIEGKSEEKKLEEIRYDNLNESKSFDDLFNKTFDLIRYLINNDKYQKSEFTRRVFEPMILYLMHNKPSDKDIDDKSKKL